VIDLFANQSPKRGRDVRIIVFIKISAGDTRLIPNCTSSTGFLESPFDQSSTNSAAK